MILSPVVAAEISGCFASDDEMETALRRMEIKVSNPTIGQFHQAGSAFLGYRRRSTNPKDRMLADFLVRAHALGQAGRLLSRDRGYYRT